MQVDGVCLPSNSRFCTCTGGGSFVTYTELWYVLAGVVVQKDTYLVQWNEHLVLFQPGLFVFDSSQLKCKCIHISSLESLHMLPMARHARSSVVVSHNRQCPLDALTTAGYVCICCIALACILKIFCQSYTTFCFWMPGTVVVFMLKVIPV